MSTTPTFFGTIKTAVAQILPADASNLVTLYTAPANGGKVESIAGTSSDTSARDVSLVITKGGVDYVIGTKTIPITAGQIAATPAVDLLNGTECPWSRLDENGNRFLLLDSGCVLKAKSLTTVTAAKALQIFAQAREV